MNWLKKYIPNILTTLRIVLVPLMFYLGLTNHYKIFIALAVTVAILDYFDGFFARKWESTSTLGMTLDAIADKFFAISLLILLIIKNPAFFYVLVLECFIALLNLYFFIKRKVSASLLVGKIKTWLICITIIVGFIGLAIPYLSNLVDIAIIITVLLQVTTLIGYFIYWQQLKKSKDIKTDYIEFYKIIEPIIIEKEFQRRKEYPHHINESVYEHVIRVSYDCYKIGKRLGMDYKALTIAGLLHDFYEKPWQYSNEKKPFFQKHAFTHAKEAVVNSKKYFGTDIITPKVESIMITHMFPLNKKIPRNREAWLLTLIDKADSIDFILHPVTLFKIFFHKKYQEEKENLEKQITHKTKSKKKKTKKSAK
ncbi:TPA: CDP-alcohol phosphatidyltransferase family protein [Candidatus Ventrenecus stercoripullorum]|nr:CDP-alcohol phosphatidyltransferase family protein [Candidatus Ventrenecus stercoripullorum]